MSYLGSPSIHPTLVSLCLALYCTYHMALSDPLPGPMAPTWPYTALHSPPGPTYLICCIIYLDSWSSLHTPYLGNEFSVCETLQKGYDMLCMGSDSHWGTESEAKRMLLQHAWHALCLSTLCPQFQEVAGWYLGYLLVWVALSQHHEGLPSQSHSQTHCGSKIKRWCTETALPSWYHHGWPADLTQ